MIVDANVLLYAVDADSRFHEAARGWLEDALNGPSRVGLPWASLLAFQRISTHPRAALSPLSPRKAWSYITEWLDADSAWVPAPGEKHAQILGRLIADGDLHGNLVTDAHLAALAIEHGVGICSADSDFARFTELTWVNPTAGNY
jgi:toxin-antitoxin system PIN domain toxin